MKKIIVLFVSISILLLAIIYLLKVLLFSLKKDEINNILNPDNTEIKVQNSVYRFKEISLKDSLTHDFYIKNTTDKELLLKNVMSNCKCIIIDFEKKPTTKNDSTKITVKFKPEVVGFAEKNIVVEANTVPPYTILALKGNVTN
ncbi:DUF1573 domain-containing protein [Flavobacterium capsici]|uniref:DUF1573 domain-containing protein n=1 Tax=Flavobacterium capsici TaxID=3075618 RepID=A0AA96ESI6_9FLAO|nr:MULTISPECIES: DUF1573 domain-containing protein [unclassified Flavobacterium]WNM17839.1 DUF1573 domain-containing protein [Flavobacterium sp. PMR2A8]WNM21892.1 DUF1573 domain-containing protein [Flavobacterium sp. PMTSA4]